MRERVKGRMREVREREGERGEREREREREHSSFRTPLLKAEGGGTSNIFGRAADEVSLSLSLSLPLSFSLSFFL